MQFIPIASSSAGCAYLLKDGDAPPLLLDCGVSIKELQRATDYKLHALAGCLLSHAHRDHSRSAMELTQRSITVCASEETFGELCIENHNARLICAGAPFLVGYWEVMPFATVHDSPGALGFLIAGKTGKCVYLTDTAYSPFRFENVTHFAIEANWSEELILDNAAGGVIQNELLRRTVGNHMSIERVIEMLNANDLSKVQEIWLLHLSDRNSDEAAFKEAVQRATGKPVYVAAK